MWNLYLRLRFVAATTADRIRTLQRARRIQETWLSQIAVR
jgi:hypothetical protein